MLRARAGGGGLKAIVSGLQDEKAPGDGRCDGGNVNVLSTTEPYAEKW